jgi:hypothetical protein
LLLPLFLWRMHACRACRVLCERFFSISLVGPWHSSSALRHRFPGNPFT